MKRIVYLPLVMIVCALLLQSCGKNTPKDVAYTWLTAYNHADFETAKKYSTPDTKVLLGTLEQLTSKLTDSNKKELKKINVNIKNTKNTTDSTADVTYTESDRPEREQVLHLVKRTGTWMVLFTKVDLSGAAPKEDDDVVEPDAVINDSTAHPGPRQGTDTMKREENRD